MTANRCPERVADLLYGSITTEERTARQMHLASCRTCAAEYHELLETIALVVRQKPTAELRPPLDNFWTRLEPALDKVDRQRPLRHRFRPAWLALAAALLFGLLLLRPDRPPGSMDAEPMIRPPDVDARLAAFLNRSHPFLLTLVNATIPEDERFGETGADERALAAELANQAMGLQETLARAVPLNQRHLLEDIELLLLQVANLRDTEYNQGLEMVRLFIERRTILFKLSLLADRD